MLLKLRLLSFLILNKNKKYQSLFTQVNLQGVPGVPRHPTGYDSCNYVKACVWLIIQI